MRSFVAITLPNPVRSRLASLQERLKTSRADVTWVRPESLHLTLRFLGEIDEKQAACFADELDALSARHAPFNAVIGSLGAFPSLEYARVIWIGIEQGCSQIIKLASECASGFASVGRALQKQDLRAHVTLGRVRSARNRFQLRKEMEDWNRKHPVEGVDFRIVSLTLFKSEISPQGPVYTPLHEANLAIT